ncbi:dienelactone hydrolase family protein [Roseovarius sp.]|uniref:dienelactone hydrolase family protein n=1 Tax=Roseovarius sp. TaxID=1486281 RepID=UPI003BAB8542
MLRVLALLTCLAAPALAEPVNFPAETSYDGTPVTLEASLHLPDGPGPHPAVILMHGCGGLQPSVAEALDLHAEALNAAGFAALILDSFGPRGIGGGHVCETYERLGDARRYRMQDARDAKAYLANRPKIDSANIFAMGQSNGGSVTIRLSQRNTREFRALAAYYPWCGAFNRLGSNATLTTPLIVFGGDADDWVPPDDCTTITAEGAEYAVHIYPGAAHSFDLQIPEQRFQGHLVGNNAAAENDSRAKMIAFFKRHLARP